MRKFIQVLSDMFFLFRFIWNQDKILYLLNCLQIALNAVNALLNALFLKFFISEIMETRRFIVVMGIVAGMCLITWAVNSLLACSTSFSKKQKLIIQNKFVQLISLSAKKMPYQELEKTWTKDLLELSKDTNNFINVIDTAVSLISSIISLVSLTAVIAIAAPIFFIPLVAFLAAEFIMSFLMQLLMNKEWREHVIGAMRKATYLSSLLNDPAYGKEIRVNSIQDWLFKRSNMRFKEYVSYAYRTSKKGSVFVILQTFLLAGVVVFSLFQIANAIIHQNLDISNAIMSLTAAISLASVGDTLSGSTSELLKSAIYIRGWRTCIELGEQTVGNETEHVPFPKHDKEVSIEFSHVFFHYPHMNYNILEDFNLKIEPGEKLALVGLNGSGKTTVVKLLCRFYPRRDIDKWNQHKRH